MAHLGNMYANGHGVAQDNATALSWFRSAADLGERCARPAASGPGKGAACLLLSGQRPALVVG